MGAGVSGRSSKLAWRGRGDHARDMRRQLSSSFLEGFGFRVLGLASMPLQDLAASTVDLPPEPPCTQKPHARLVVAVSPIDSRGASWLGFLDSDSATCDPHAVRDARIN